MPKRGNFVETLRVEPGKNTLGDIPPRGTQGWTRAEAERRTERLLPQLYDLQYKLHAESKQALLVVLQAMDAGGKDGTIRKVMGGLNPQGTRVASFKVPTEEELAHDFLWRIHKQTPAKGEIGIFNRSHYGDVLVVRVRNLVPKKVWSKRYDQINDFEKILAENGVRIVKFFLHISKEEQRERLLARLEDPVKHWKASPGDWEERKRWDDYQEAYEAALENCSTDWAPWYVIPADRKWFRNLTVASILVDTLKDMDPQLPKPKFDVSKIVTD